MILRFCFLISLFSTAQISQAQITSKQFAFQLNEESVTNTNTAGSAFTISFPDFLNDNQQIVMKSCDYNYSIDSSFILRNTSFTQPREVAPFTTRVRLERDSAANAGSYPCGLLSETVQVSDPFFLDRGERLPFSVNNSGTLSSSFANSSSISNLSYEVYSVGQVISGSNSGIFLANQNLNFQASLVVTVDIYTESANDIIASEEVSIGQTVINPDFSL